MQNYFDNEATSSALHATMKPARGGKCFVTLSTYEDRKEALLNTTIMDDAGTYRSKGSKMNTTSSQQTIHQNDTLDSGGSKHETKNHIPKPPPVGPFHMASNNGIYRNNNCNNNTLTTETSSNNTNQTFSMNDQIAAQRSSNSSQNLNVYNGSNETYSGPNKTQPATSSGLNINRQTLRLGTVTIGEYRQQGLRREPEKFDFISTQKKGRGDSGDTTPTNEALQSELQNTLSRANLRKSNGNSYTEHQRNCPLHQQQQQQLLQQRQSIDYGSNGYAMEEMSKKLQKSILNENNTPEQLLTKTNNRSLNNTTAGSTGVGILKHGNRNSTSSSSKSTEKSIKFS